MGFEPTCRLPDKTLSRRPRYDHFGTSPGRVRGPAGRRIAWRAPLGARERIIITGAFYWSEGAASGAGFVLISRSAKILANGEVPKRS